jgi:UDP-N-acetylglucosamine diphosphorylase/glucosamine-1-phosphate N-acetyltransferase
VTPPPALYLLDPEPAPGWAPFAGVRPLCELRAGAPLVRERWEEFVGVEATEIFTLPHLAGFVEPGVPRVAARHPVTGPAIIGSSTFAPRGLAPALPGGGAFRLSCGGITVGWGVGPGATWDGPQPHAAAVEVPGLVLHGVYDLVRALEPLLGEDLRGRLGDSDAVPAGSVVLGDPAWIALHEAAVEPGVVFDVRNGPVVLEAGVEVRSGTRLEGPLWAGANTRLVGGPIRSSAIGPRSTVRGEVSNCVFLGYANKAHDGFVGHSVIGRWANLGAGTITSNLKNTYGLVRLEVAGAAVETGMQFLGSLVGDHAKTAIGTLLGTGTVIGAGANVFGAVRPPKYVPPFAWGAEGAARTSREGFLTVAGRVLPRRDVALDPATRAALVRMYDWVTR